jgi:hypothetical protein
VKEVKRMGALEGSKRTAWQSEIARFHTENPNNFWIRNLRETFATHNLSLVESARLYALMNVVHADAIIACFDSKVSLQFLAAGHGDPERGHRRQSGHRS